MDVNAVGELEGIVDFDQVMAQARALFPDDDVGRAAVALLDTPGVRAGLEQRVGLTWSTWVGSWTEWDLAAGEKRTGDDVVAFAGEELPLALVAEHLGPVPDAPGLVRLRASEVAEGEAFVRAIASTVGTMMDAAGKAERPPAGFYKTARRETTYQVDTDPATLRPWRAVFAMEMRMTFADGQEKHQLQRRESEFDWARAQGACAPR
jgi:hypothetical protein